MNLEESIRRILKETTNFKYYLERRIGEKNIEKGFQSGLIYGKDFFKRYPPLKLRDFRELVMNVFMDVIYDELSDSDKENFLYGDVRNYLTDLYSNKISVQYNKFANKLEQSSKNDVK